MVLVVLGVGEGRWRRLGNLVGWCGGRRWLGEGLGKAEDGVMVVVCARFDFGLREEKAKRAKG